MVAVIATHTVATIPGGFLSVDVFFVLSGYLITSLLVAEWRQSDTISLGRFWSRRARRLLPALFLMLTAVGAGAALWPQIFGSPSLRGDTLATVFYVANWHFIADHTNYFLAAGRASPLLHTWSLAIEEQFYLVWPIVVLAVLKLRRPRRRAAGDEWRVRRPPSPSRITDVVSWCSSPSPSPAPWPRRCGWRCSPTAGATRRAASTPVTPAPRPSWWAPPSPSGACCGARPVPAGRAPPCGVGAWPAWSGRPCCGRSSPPNSLLVFRGGFFVAALCTAGVIACVANLPTSRLATVLCFGPLALRGSHLLRHVPLVLAARARLVEYPHPSGGLSAPGGAPGGDHRGGDGLGLPRRTAHPPGPSPGVVGPAWPCPSPRAWPCSRPSLATVGVSDVAAASVTADGNAPAATAAAAGTGAGTVPRRAPGRAPGRGPRRRPPSP